MSELGVSITKEEVTSFLKTNFVANISTTDGDKPTCSPIIYVIDDELNFYFVTNTDSFKAKNPNMGKVLGGIGTAAAWAGRNTAEKVPLIDNRWKRRAKARLDAEEEKEKARLAEQSSAPMPRGATSAQIPDAFSKSVNQAISIIVSNKSRPASALEAPHVLYQIVTSDDFRHSVESTVARVVDQRSGNASLVTTKSPIRKSGNIYYCIK
jgi:uncharacterized protein YhbP (UPF0306 family)